MRSIAIALICGFVGFGLSFFLLPKKSEVRYNCELAEISPDFPAQVREQCRKLRGQQ